MFNVPFLVNNENVLKRKRSWKLGYGAKWASNVLLDNRQNQKFSIFDFIQVDSWRNLEEIWRNSFKNFKQSSKVHSFSISLKVLENFKEQLSVKGFNEKKQSLLYSFLKLKSSTSSFSSVQCDHFCLTPCETHCLNLFLDCSSPSGFWSALLSFPLGNPSKSYPCNSFGRHP